MTETLTILGLTTLAVVGLHWLVWYAFQTWDNDED